MKTLLDDKRQNLFGGKYMKYIAYGSNMIEHQMKNRCPDALFYGTGYLEYAQLEFYLHATVERTEKQDDRVPVVVWEISERDEKSLDRYEGYPNYYIKERWQVQMSDGSQVEGMVYVMNLFRQSPARASYYEGIKEAYLRLGFHTQISTILEPALQRSLQRGKEQS